MTTLPDKELLRPDEIASYFSLSVKTVYGWIAEGKIPAVKIGASRVIRVPRKDVLKLIGPAVK